MASNSSLLQWLATFQLDGRPAIELKDDAYYNLADGYVCARILNQISPVYFTDSWLEGIKPVAPNGSWRLRVSNLKRILQKIHDYASDLQSSEFMLGAINPDVTVIAQNFESDQICRLIQLILFCAIHCDKKEDYIRKIRDLPTQVKQDIKEAIEELLINKGGDNQQHKMRNSLASNELPAVKDNDNTKHSNHRNDTNTSQSGALSSPARTGKGNPRNDSSRSEPGRFDTLGRSFLSDPPETVDEIRKKLDEALAIKEAKAQSCHELEIRLKQLQIERDHLFHENEKLLSKRTATTTKSIPSIRRLSGPNRDLNATNLSSKYESTINQIELEDDDRLSQDVVLSQNKRLQNEIYKLKEELIRIETEKEDFRLKSNLLKEDLDKITSRHDELRSKADQAKRLQDELDEQKHITERVASYEAVVENLVKKNNEMKKELKSLEDKNISHVQNMVRLEQENQQLTSTVNQMEIYRRQLNDAQTRLSQETHRADQLEVELSRFAEKFEVTKRENERLYEATNQLIRNNSSYKDRQGELVDQSKVFDNINLNEKSARAANEGVEDRLIDDGVESIQDTAIDLRERIARLEMENQLLMEKTAGKTEVCKSVERLLEECNEKCRHLERENQQVRKKMLLLESKMRDMLNQAEQPATSSANITQDPNPDNILIKRIEDLQRLLYQREQELRDAEFRYKKNIDKAKEVIKALNVNQSMNSLHPSCMSSASFNSSSLDEINALKLLLREKEERLIELERELLKFGKLKEVHEHLILSAFDGITAPMQWENSDELQNQSTLTSPPNDVNSQVGKHHP